MGFKRYGMALSACPDFISEAKMKWFLSGMSRFFGGVAVLR